MSKSAKSTVKAGAQFDQTVKLKNASLSTDRLSITFRLGYCHYQQLVKD